MTIADQAPNAAVAGKAAQTWQRFGKAWETGDTSSFDDWFAKDSSITWLRSPT